MSLRWLDFGGGTTGASCQLQLESSRKVLDRSERFRGNVSSACRSIGGRTTPS